MAKESLIEAEGIVDEVLPSGTFKVKMKNNHIITCYLSGKVCSNRIQVIEGDSVKIEMSPYDLTKGRITYREKNQKGDK